MTPEFLRYVKKVQQTLANYIELPKTPCATCTKFLKCNDKEFLTFNMPCSAYTNTKNQKITFSDKQKFLIDILRNHEQNNEKPETFIKLITDNCKKLKLPKHITQSILPKGKEHQQEKVQRTPSATKQELKTSFLHNLKKYKTIKQAAKSQVSLNRCLTTGKGTTNNFNRSFKTLTATYTLTKKNKSSKSINRGACSTKPPKN